MQSVIRAWSYRLLLIASRLTMVLIFVMSNSSAVHAEYGDVILNTHSEKAGMRPVIFPHWLHRIRYKCNACHNDSGFKMRSGADDMRMANIIDGKYCGMCHNDQISWGTQQCQLCHSGIPGLQTGIIGGDSTGGPGKW